MRKQCGELFKQVLNTQEEAKMKRFSEKKRAKNYRNKVETYPPCSYCKKKQITSRENVCGDQTLSVENVVRLDILKEFADQNNMKKKRILLLNNLKRSSCLLHHVFQQAIARVIPN
jgi:hypothetical protein